MRAGPDSQPSLHTDRHRESLIRWGAAAMLVLLVLVCYSPAFGAEFVSWDDLDNLIKNTKWRGLGGEQLRWMFTAFHIGHYQPLTWLSYAVEYKLWGLEPSGYHVTNVLIHAANAVLLFFLSRRLLSVGFGATDADGEPVPRTDLTIVAGLGAVLWAVHPLRVESVAWVTERRDVLSTLFMLLSAIAYVRAVQAGGPGVRSPRWYVVCCVLLAMSCLSKAWGMTFFVPLLLLDVYPLRRLPLNPFKWLSWDGLRVVAQKLPMIAIGAGTAILAARAQHAAHAAKSLEQWPLSARLVQCVYGLWFYFQKSFAPSDLSPLYQLPFDLHPFEPRFVAADIFAGIALAVLIVSAARRPQTPAIPVAAGIYLVMLAPVLGLLQSGEQIVADRYSYLAVMPLCVLAPLAGLWLLRRGQAGPNAPLYRLALPAAAAIAVLSLGLLTYSQTAVWRDSLTLWSHAVRVAPCSFSCDYLADEYLHRSKEARDPKERAALAEQAAEAYQQAVQLAPRDGRAWFSLGTLLKEYGRKAEAEQALKNSIPYLPVAYQAYQNLGIIYMEQGRKEEAIRQFELAIAELEDPSKTGRPVSGGPYMVLGFARKEQGRPDDAEALFRKAIPYQDTHDDALQQLRVMGKS